MESRTRNIWQCSFCRPEVVKLFTPFFLLSFTQLTKVTVGRTGIFDKSNNLYFCPIFFSIFGHFFQFL